MHVQYSCSSEYCNENRIQEQVRVIYNETFFFLSRGGALINASSSFHLSFSILCNWTFWAILWVPPSVLLHSSRPVCTYFLGGLTQSHARLPSLGSVFFTWISVFCVPVRHSEEEEEEAWVVTENSYYYYYCVADGHLLVIFLFQSNHFLLLLINALKCSVSGLRVRASNDDH